MRTIILYSSKHGATREAAELLAQHLPADTVVAPITDAPDIAVFDCVVLGSAIYAGKPLKTMQDFCKQHLELLLQKKLGLFICALADPVIIRQELAMAYPAPIRRHAVIASWFGGKITPDRLTAAERAILKVIRKAKLREAFRHDEIQRVATTLNPT